ncbi:MAG TPA: signal recognition particle-docking protein FtsY [Candidatus Acutalibacter stercoravium]|nr:signal recognition particle-docking protein FtsY [Candidatus Acutalibacter stercoravium]
MGIFDKIREGLKKTRDNISGQITQMVNSFTKIDEELFEELEELLVMGDVGMNTAQYICDQLRKKIKEKGITDPSLIMGELKAIVSEMLQGDNELHTGTKPSIILVIGVNGVGKTTTIGKLASRLKGEGKSVILGAADTFRAAAIEQLEVWADRAGVPLIKHQEGADPAAVVFDTIAAAKARGCDVIICDTAGRLHNKKNLMDELGKISRVIDRELPGCDRETLLVLDAATGQNAVNQAREFQSAAGITGIVLTKLDGTPKGGVVLPIMQDLGLPVKFIGVGERVDDLQPFDPDAFANALFDNERDDTPVFAEDRAAAQLEEQRQEEEVLQEQDQAGEDALEGEELFQQLEERPLTEESLLSDIDAMLGESRAEEPQEELEEPQPEKKKRRFWPFGRKRDEE